VLNAESIQHAELNIQNAFSMWYWIFRISTKNQ